MAGIKVLIVVFSFGTLLTAAVSQGDPCVDQKHRLCCNGLVYVRSGFRPGCCGDIGYDSYSHHCCNQTIVHKGAHTRCCDNQAYDRTHQTCRAGYLQDRTNIGSTCCRTSQGWRCCVRGESCCDDVDIISSGSSVDIPGFRPACCSLSHFDRVECCRRVAETARVVPACCERDGAMPQCCVSPRGHWRCCPWFEPNCCADSHVAVTLAPTRTIATERTTRVIFWTSPTHRPRQALWRTDIPTTTTTTTAPTTTSRTTSAVVYTPPARVPSCCRSASPHPSCCSKPSWGRPNSGARSPCCHGLIRLTCCVVTARQQNCCSRPPPSLRSPFYGQMASCCSSSSTQQCCTYGTRMTGQVPVCCGTGSNNPRPTRRSVLTTDREQDTTELYTEQEKEVPFITYTRPKPEVSTSPPIPQQLGRETSCCDVDEAELDSCCADYFRRNGGEQAVCCERRRRPVETADLGRGDIPGNWAYLYLADDPESAASETSSCCSVSDTGGARVRCCREGYLEDGLVRSCCSLALEEENDRNSVSSDLTRNTSPQQQLKPQDRGNKHSSCCHLRSLLEHRTCCNANGGQPKACCPDTTRGAKHQYNVRKPQTPNHHIIQYGNQPIQYGSQRVQYGNQHHGFNQPIRSRNQRIQYGNPPIQYGIQHPWVAPAWDVCSGIHYSPLTSICCSGFVRLKTGRHPRCCGKFSYDADVYQCCPGNQIRVSCSYPAYQPFYSNYGR